LKDAKKDISTGRDWLAERTAIGQRKLRKYPYFSRREKILRKERPRR